MNLIKAVYGHTKDEGQVRDHIQKNLNTFMYTYLRLPTKQVSLYVCATSFVFQCNYFLFLETIESRFHQRNSLESRSQ
jgi:hypothetical protein